jgi:hypothetical protein
MRAIVGANRDIEIKNQKSGLKKSVFSFLNY